MNAVVTREELKDIVKSLKAKGEKIGFTSGAFDLLHKGHLSYLREAKKKCSVLLVGINSDSSVRKLKGDERPLTPENERAELVAALKPVDYAFIFNEVNNNKNIQELKPDIYFKGGDYKEDELSSAPLVKEYGGEVVILKEIKGRSTSELIKKIRDKDPISECIKYPLNPPAPAVFVDRDGTILKHIEYLHEPEKVELLPQAAEGLKKLKNAGFKIIIVTNQPGIGLGYFTKEDLFSVHKKMLKLLSEKGVLVDKIYYSPYALSENTPCRKPNTQLIEKALNELNIIREKSWFIGDSDADILAAKNAGLKSALVGKMYRAGKIEVQEEDIDVKGENLLEIAEKILRTPLITKQKKKNYYFPYSPKTALLIGSYSRKIAHDLNNHLAVISTTSMVLSAKAKKLSEKEEYHSVVF
ncbi:MAG: HAD-IIIA family hydrolase, partial [Candidatus Dadabacteria bacterium]